MQPQVEDIVRNVFNNPDEQTFREVMNVVSVSQHPPGAYLCHEGSTERTFYIIVDGEVAVAKQKPDGGKTILARKRSGDFFGEMSLLSGEPRTADVYTTVNSTTVELGLDAFRRVIRSNPVFLEGIVKLISQYRHNHELLIEEDQEYLVFVSYSRMDQVLVQRIIEDLEKVLKDEPIQLWVDKAGISAGTVWNNEIQEALEQTTVMLLMLSNHAKASKYVQAEWNYCFEEDKKIVPVLIDHQCKIPFLLKNIHHIDLREYHNDAVYASCVAEIVTTLRRLTTGG